MALDTLIKKFFPALVGLGLIIIAYFQASGVVQLIASGALKVDSKELTTGSLRQPPRSNRSVDKRRTARPIIDHNFFDHETDLDPPPPPPDPVEADQPKPGIDFSDPLSAAPCEGVEVRLVTESPDPSWSLAVLKGPGDEEHGLRRVGDAVGSFEVAYIGYNRLESSPAVWMTNDVQLCQALLFEVESKTPKKTAAAKPAPPKRPAPAVPTKRRGAPKVPAEIASKIEKVSETDFNVDRSVIDNILENQATLMRSARIVPEKGKDGKTVGIRLFGIRPDTLLGTLGLQNGDRLETINGFNMASPEDALNAYARLRTAEKLAVKVTRRGKPMNIDFNIK